MTDSRGVAIAGAGLMGRLLALLLLDRGYRVTLFDRDPVAGGRAAAWTGAGMLAPWAELESADCGVFELGVQSLALWPSLADRLGREAIDYREGGSLLVAHAGDRSEYQRTLSQLRSRLGGERSAAAPKDAGSNGRNAERTGLQALDRQELQRLEPDLPASFAEGLWLPCEAWLDGQKLMTRLAEAVLAQGGRWHADTPVLSAEPHRIVHVTGEETFDTVIDTRGTGGAQGFEDLRGVRGELLWLYAPEVTLTRPVRLMHPRYRLYLVPRSDHHYVLGATQIESDADGPVTVRSALELLSAAYTLHPGFAEARVIKTDANLRPALDDNLPRLIVAPGLVRVNGLFRHGFLLAPLIAQQVLQHLATPVFNADN